MSFTAREILEIAVQIERNGVKFYRRAAELAGESDHRTMLDGLAEMESDHQDLFEKIQTDLGGLGDDDDFFSADREMLQYIRAMADGHVFDTGLDPSAILTGEETTEEILSTAIGLEKESIVYYAALKEVVDDPRVCRQLESIIREEMQHIVDLSGQREALK